MLDGWPPPLFDPAGPYAWSVTTLSWVLLAMSAGVLLVVLAALYVALSGNERLRSKLGGTTIIWIGGIAFPVVVLTLLLIWGLTLTRDLSQPAPDGAMRVRVTGEMWWWRVAYLDSNGEPLIQDANELHIPAGKPVVLELESADVIHSFWVPRLSGKLDMIPGRRNALVIQADRPGVYGGQCAEFCGGPHALMGFTVVAHPQQRFDALMQQRLTRASAAAAPAGPGLARGAQLFGSAGCAACHRIAGTGANGLAGPDLTHVGSRRTLGAGILPNNRGTMMGWIANSQAIKPNNRMPPYTVLSGEEVASLASYLEAQR
ncbi:MAG: cytochrome c oxidase subunit II [Sphingomonas sp.]|nr:cytochrome c oxidase subunit II [Sphingomonas sp.]